MNKLRLTMFLVFAVAGSAFAQPADSLDKKETKQTVEADAQKKETVKAAETQAPQAWQETSSEGVPSWLVYLALGLAVAAPACVYFLLNGKIRNENERLYSRLTGKLDSVRMDIPGRGKIEEICARISAEKDENLRSMLLGHMEDLLAENRKSSQQIPVREEVVERPVETVRYAAYDPAYGGFRNMDLHSEAADVDTFRLTLDAAAASGTYTLLGNVYGAMLEGSLGACSMEGDTTKYIDYSTLEPGVLQYDPTLETWTVSKKTRVRFNS